MAGLSCKLGAIRHSIHGSQVHYQRFIYLTFLVCAVILGLTFRSATIAGLAVAGAPDTMLAGTFPISSLVGIGIGIISFLVALRNREAVVFTDEVWVELFKVKWPDREETQNSTLIVVVSTMVLAGSLAIFDWGWGAITERFLYSAG